MAPATPASPLPREQLQPRRTLGLVAGVIVQIVLGKLVVDKLLSPPWVMSHFLVSMVLLANALVLCRRAAQPDVGFGFTDSTTFGLSIVVAPLCFAGVAAV